MDVQSYCEGNACPTEMSGGTNQSSAWHVASVVTSSLALAALLLNLYGRYWWSRKETEDKCTETDLQDDQVDGEVEKSLVVQTTQVVAQELTTTERDLQRIAEVIYSLSPEDSLILIRHLGTTEVEALFSLRDPQLEDTDMAHSGENGNGHSMVNGLLVDLVDALRSTVDLHGPKEGLPDRLAENLARIETLEHPCNTLHHEFDKLSVSMVRGSEDGEDLPESEKETNGVGKETMSTFHKRRTALRSQWASIRRLLFCVDVHLRNSTAYQQFYYETDELKKQLDAFYTHAKEDMSSNVEHISSPKNLKAELREYEAVWDTVKLWDNALEELSCRSRKIVPVKKRIEPLSESVAIRALCNYKTQESSIDTLKLWDSAIEELSVSSRKVVPVHKRINELTEPLPIRALCSYKTSEFAVDDGEQLLLLDNSDIKEWKVKKPESNTEYSVPAVICLIPPTDDEALVILAKLRRKLDRIYYAMMEIWKQRLMFYIREILENFLNNKDKFFRGVNKEHKSEINELLKVLSERVDTEFQKHEDHDVVIDLINRLTGTVDGADQNRREYGKLDEEVIEVLLRLVNLFKRYESLSKQYKVFQAYCCTTDDQYDSEDEWEAIDEAVDISVTTQSIERETSSYSQASSEVSQKFTIKAVLDPRDDTEISIEEAVTRGILDTERGIYNNLASGDQYPIPIAMTAGLIIVESTQTKKSEEKKAAVGLVTVRVKQETRPYTVLYVTDPRDDSQITVEEAERRGVFNKESGKWTNPSTGDSMGIDDAIDCGGIKVEYDEDATDMGEPEVSTKHFAVFGVLDRRRDRRVPFFEACKQGLIDKEEGTYYDNLDAKTIDVVEAFQMGFVKARTIDNPDQIELYLSRDMSGSQDSLNSTASM